MAVFRVLSTRAKNGVDKKTDAKPLQHWIGRFLSISVKMACRQKIEREAAPALDRPCFVYIVY